MNRNRIIFYILIGIGLGTLLTFFISPKQNQNNLSPTPTPRTTEPSATLTSSPRSPTAPANVTSVKLFFVALDDQGKSGQQIGCGDSIVSVRVTVPSTSAPLTAALTRLLATKSQNYNSTNLYNSLYQSNLILENATVTNGTARINLRGNLQLGGVCDNPRVLEQIRQTALQFNTVKRVEIMLNGVPLEERLSEKGE